jgi:hypothetical protein
MNPYRFFIPRDHPGTNRDFIARAIDLSVIDRICNDTTIDFHRVGLGMVDYISVDIQHRSSVLAAAQKQLAAFQAWRPEASSAIELPVNEPVRPIPLGRVTEITVHAGTSFNHPYEQFSNFKPGISLTVQIDEDADRADVLRAWQARAHDVITEEKARILEGLAHEEVIRSQRSDLSYHEDQLKRHEVERLRHRESAAETAAQLAEYRAKPVEQQQEVSPSLVDSMERRLREAERGAALADENIPKIRAAINRRKNRLEALLRGENPPPVNDDADVPF